MKRLLCILSGMNAGGAETFMMKIYRNLDRTKYQIDFCINAKDKCFYEDEILNMGGKIYRIPSKSENIKEFKLKLKGIVKDNSYSNVLRITSNAMGFMDLKIAKQAGAKVCCARSSNASDGGGLKSVICHRLGKLLYARFVDVMIAPSDLSAIYTFGKKNYEDGNVHILHNGVDLDVYRFVPEKRKKIREEFSIGLETKLVGHVGRFNEQKNHMFLLDVFKEIHMMDSSAKFLLVGSGELEESVRKKTMALGIYDKVIFAGLRSDIPDILSAMDVFIMPSFYEGMPNTVIEAQATGLPCVIADTITREADITGLVQYLSLSDSSSKWAQTAICAAELPRRNTVDDFRAHGYDIACVTKEIVSLLGVEAVSDGKSDEC